MKKIILVVSSILLSQFMVNCISFNQSGFIISNEIINSFTSPDFLVTIILLFIFSLPGLAISLLVIEEVYWMNLVLAFLILVTGLSISHYKLDLSSSPQAGAGMVFSSVIVAIVILFVGFFSRLVNLIISIFQTQTNQKRPSK